MPDPRLDPLYVHDLYALMLAGDRQRLRSLICSDRFRAPQSRQAKNKLRRLVAEFEELHGFGPGAVAALQRELAELRARQPGRRPSPKNSDCDRVISIHLNAGLSASETLDCMQRDGWGENTPTIRHIYHVRTKQRKRRRQAAREIEETRAPGDGG
jgi:hypothetical protein